MAKDTGKHRIQAMTSRLEHRGPDDEGYYEDDGLWLGHRRLAIIDLSDAAHQPMVVQNLVIVLNGEIYNYRQLREELSQSGVEFQTQADTEVLLRSYQAWGKDALQRVRGMFAFAIWDRRARRLFCARDPFGKKPLYFHWSGRAFTFASEVEALVTGLPGRPAVETEHIAYFLLHGYYPGGRTAYTSVGTIGPGVCVEVDIDMGTLREQAYVQTSFRMNSSRPEDEDDLESRCQGALSTAVKRRYESDVPVGIVLSGGVDSSLVTLTAARHGLPIQTFTVSFLEATHDESSFAAQVAKKVDSDHRVIEVAPHRLEEVVPLLLKAYGEPFGDYSAIPAYFLFEALAKHVSVGLVGDGGDELFLGYADARAFWARDLLRPFLRLLPSFGVASYAGMLFHKSLNVRRLGYGLVAGTSDGADLFIALRRSGWAKTFRERWMRPEAAEMTGSNSLEGDLRRQFKEAGRTDLERYANMTLDRLTQDFLVKIDRASMAHSVEARSPLLDIELFNEVRGARPSALLKRGRAKSILKDLVGAQMGRPFVERPKMGFTPPLRSWLAEPRAAKWVEGRLSSRHSFAYSLFAPDGIRELIRRHREGEDHTGRVWNLLMLNEWHARFIAGGDANW